MNFMQQQMLMQQHLQQMQLFQQQQQQGDLNGLVLIPKKRKSLDNGNVSSPSGQSNGQGGAPLALQDIPVRNSFSLPDPGAPSSEPSTGPGEAKQETSAAANAADHEVDAHLNAMDDAFNARGDHRAALKRPASKMDQKGKGKGSPIARRPRAVLQRRSDLHQFLREDLPVIISKEKFTAPTAPSRGAHSRRQVVDATPKLLGKEIPRQLGSVHWI